MKPASGEPAFDFATLASADASQPGRNLRAQLWLLGFLALLVASVVALVLYLQNFESEEEARQNMADAQWLEQSIAFHFRRLEDDLRSQARAAARHRQTATTRRSRSMAACCGPNPA